MMSFNAYLPGTSHEPGPGVGARAQQWPKQTKPCFPGAQLLIKIHK